MEERNKAIMEALQNGISTMSDLSRQYGISRQRISEIFHHTIGQKIGYYRKQKKVLMEQHRERKLLEVKYKCAACGIPVTFKEAKHKSKYCQSCHELTKHGQVDINIKLTCQECGNTYHPYQTKRTIHNYCSEKCFHNSRIKDKFAYAQKMANKRKE